MDKMLLNEKSINSKSNDLNLKNENMSEISFDLGLLENYLNRLSFN
jgi:hypothetical protein